MTKNIKTKLMTVMSLFVLVFSFASMPVAFASSHTAATPSANSSKDDICQGAGLIGDADGCQDNGGPKVDSVIKTAINFFSLIVGLISVVMIIVAGVKFVTSGGSTEKVTGAKNTILYAVIGLIIVALAQVIVKFVLSKASK